MKPLLVVTEVPECVDGALSASKFSGATTSGRDAERLGVRAGSGAVEELALSEKDLAREIKRLEKQMLEHARNLEFEQAARVRDQLALLKSYMQNFDPGFLALRPTPEQLPALAKDYKIYYKKVDGKTPTSYTMDHSAGSYLYDPQGRLRVYQRYGSGAAALAADVRTLLDEAR